MSATWGPFRIFQHPFGHKTPKIEGGPFGEHFRKSHNAGKKLKGDPLVSPGIACYAEKRKNLFGSVPNRYNLQNFSKILYNFW